MNNSHGLVVRGSCVVLKGYFWWQKRLSVLQAEALTLCWQHGEGRSH